MLVLGIESSCDETALALLQADGSSHSLLAEEISSQVDLHRLYGGVVPELAARQHLQALPLLYDRILKQASVTLSEIDLIGVTTGPGLKGCLLMGMNFARGLSFGAAKPIVPVNHIEGHVLAPVLDNPDLTYPFLSLVVSGGHTEIQVVRAPGDYTLIARTTDDAAGEAFDKSAHLLGFDYPGGAMLAALADSAPRQRDFSLPKVMREAPGFSFSGLKTAISLLVNEHKEEMEQDEALRADLAAAIQDSIIDALLYKLKEAIKHTGIRTVTVTGGVSANKCLRDKVAGVAEHVFFPEMVHCMDNAAMIAYVAYVHRERQLSQGAFLDVHPRWPIETGSDAGI